MYTLYYSPGAASLVVHWLLIEIGARHELRKLDLQAGEHKRPEYLSVNPGGVVPTLLVHGGRDELADLRKCGGGTDANDDEQPAALAGR